CQQNVIRELEPLRSHLRLMAKECDQKILAQWGEEQTGTEILKREKQQLLKDIKVDRLQSELFNLYLQFRKERDACRLLIWQLNELKGEDNKDSVELKVALKVCQEDLTKTQEKLTRKDNDSFHQLQAEYHTLQEIHRRSIEQTKTNISTAVQTEDSESHVQSHNQLDHKDELINIDDVSKNSRVSALESRESVKTAESHEKTHEHVTVGQIRTKLTAAVMTSSLTPPER
ncbi:hypothetical protein CRENBAI_006785, partial [Crenichthys baileyi]